MNEKDLTRELDGRWGHYVGANWNYSDHHKISVLYYDNRADSLAFNGKEYAWKTRFSSASWHFQASHDWELISQFMRGFTLMGNEGVTWTHPKYQAYSLLLSKRFRHQRMTRRYDRFKVDDIDSFNPDPNLERGHAWTLAHYYYITKKQQLITELLRVDSRRDARALQGDALRAIESQLQINYRIFF